MTPVSLPYNNGKIDLRLPNQVSAQILLPRPVPALKSPQRELMRAVENPVAGPSLESLARSASGQVLIVCADQTRDDGRAELLPWLLDLLNSYGVADSRIRIIVAYGSHKPAGPGFFRKVVGPASERVRVLEHDVSGPMVDCGTTPYGTPVRVNPAIGKSALVITVSSVVHHYFAGYGGGRKMIVPGLASLETIRANHSLIWEDAHSTGGRHPKARSGVLDGNPVSEDLMAAARLALGKTPHFSIASVLTLDHQFGYFAAGDIDASHRAAAKVADKYFTVNLESPADVVIASAGGIPKDLNLIQAHKGLDNAVRAVKPGGTVLYVMACASGLGSPVVETYASMTPDEIRASLAREYVVYGQTVHALKTKTGANRVVVVSELDRGMLSTLGFVPATDLDHAVELIAGELGEARRVYVMPRADVTVPKEGWIE